LIASCFTMPLASISPFNAVTEHPRSHMVIEDTGLGIERSDKLVVVQVITRKRKTPRPRRIATRK
jgi:4-oxalocrotonate tautomerase